MPISKRVREAVLLQATDPTIGLMPTLDAIAARDGEIVAKHYLIDWTLGKGQFFESALSADDIDKTTPDKYPLSTLRVANAVNKNKEKFRTFAGDVFVEFVFHLSWREYRAQTKGEAYGDAFEEALFFTFNSPGVQGWATPLVYNGDLDVKRSPLDRGGQMFRQSIKADFIFEVYE